MLDFYPTNFRLRLHFQISSQDTRNRLFELARREPRLDLCDVEDTPKYGDVSGIHPKLWRFLPMLDDQVSVFFSRDLDSDIGLREVRAVKEFLEDNDAKVKI